MTCAARILVPPLLLMTWLPGGTSSPESATVDDKFEQQVAEFRRAVDHETFKSRREGLLDLIALDEPEVLSVVAGEFRKVTTSFQGNITRIAKLRFDIEQSRRVVDDLLRLLVNDESFDTAVEEEQKRLKSLEESLELRSVELSESEPWMELLGDELTKFASGMGSGARAKAEKKFWKTARKTAKVETQIAHIAVLGRIGSSGSAVELQEFVEDFVEERVRLERQLNKQITAVRKLEKRLQEEAVRYGGRIPSMEQYARTSEDARRSQVRIGEIVRLCEAVIDAGASALHRETSEARATSMKALLRAQKKGEDGVRRLTLAMLGRSGISDARATLLAMLRSEPDPLVCSFLIDSLAAPSLGVANAELDDYLIEDGLTHKSWLVKGSAAQALARLRPRAAVPALIEHYQAEVGRTRDDMRAALRALTGLSFNGSAQLWRQWWENNGEGFVVPSAAEAAKLLAKRELERRGGSGFFGIESDSKRVLFVIDLSWSMIESMTSRYGQRRGPDPIPPKKGEQSRIEMAKLALKTAIRGLPRGGSFNIIFYASDVWSWKPRLTPTTDKSIEAAQSAVENLTAIGGTNLFGALKSALDMAGVKSSDEWTEPTVDTIYFLSDGQASVGLTTDADEILNYVRERNSSAGIAIHTIGLSNSQDSYLMRRLAEENGGSYVSR